MLLAVHIDFFTFAFPYSLIAGVIGASQMTSPPVFSIFPCSPLPSGTWGTSGLFIPLSSNFFCRLPFLLPPFAVLCKMVLARPDELETCPYHCSLRVFLSRDKRGSMGLRYACSPFLIIYTAWKGALVSESYTVPPQKKNNGENQNPKRKVREGVTLYYVKLRNCFYDIVSFSSFR